MTNFEFYKNELMAIADNGSDVAIIKGKPAACDSVMCLQCELGEFNCGASLIHWLFAEHVERPKINKRTKMFFDAIETGWVARDKDGRVCLYAGMPAKCSEFWSNTTYGGDWLNISVNHIYDFLSKDLDFIKWEDNEPWRVEDIRSLEVVD